MPYTTSIVTNNSVPPPPAESVEESLRLIDDLKFFLATAPANWQENQIIRRYYLNNQEGFISCIFWKNIYYITGTDIVRAISYKFKHFGRELSDQKKFEEGVFSDLRSLKCGTDAVLEMPKSDFLKFLHKNSCLRTQKKQKVFFWFSVPHDKLFSDALERDLKKELSNQNATTRPMHEPALSFKYDQSKPLYDQLLNHLNSKKKQVEDLDSDATNILTASDVAYGDDNNNIDMDKTLSTVIENSNNENDVEAQYLIDSEVDEKSSPLFVSEKLPGTGVSVTTAAAAAAAVAAATAAASAGDDVADTINADDDHIGENARRSGSIKSDYEDDDFPLDYFQAADDYLIETNDGIPGDFLDPSIFFNDAAAHHQQQQQQLLIDQSEKYVQPSSITNYPQFPPTTAGQQFFKTTNSPIQAQAQFYQLQQQQLQLQQQQQQQAAAQAQAAQQHQQQQQAALQLQAQQQQQAAAAPYDYLSPGIYDDPLAIQQFPSYHEFSATGPQIPPPISHSTLDPYISYASQYPTIPSSQQLLYSYYEQQAQQVQAFSPANVQFLRSFASSAVHPTSANSSNFPHASNPPPKSARLIQQHHKNMLWKRQAALNQKNGSTNLNGDTNSKITKPNGLKRQVYKNTALQKLHLQDNTDTTTNISNIDENSTSSAPNDTNNTTINSITNTTNTTTTGNGNSTSTSTISTDSESQLQRPQDSVRKPKIKIEQQPDLNDYLVNTGDS